MFAWRRVHPVVATSFYLTGTGLTLIGEQVPEELAEIVSVARKMDMPRKEIGGAISVISQKKLPMKYARSYQRIGMLNLTIRLKTTYTTLD